MLNWTDDGDQCWSLKDSNNLVRAAYGPDPSKPGYFRGFAFDKETGIATHESIWCGSEDIQQDINDWFDSEDNFRPYSERNDLYRKRLI